MDKKDLVNAILELGIAFESKSLVEQTEILDSADALICANVFTKEDMEKAFNAGADKACWSLVDLKGSTPSRMPIFDKWFSKFKN